MSTNIGPSQGNPDGIQGPGAQLPPGPDGVQLDASGKPIAAKPSPLLDTSSSQAQAQAGTGPGTSTIGKGQNLPAPGMPVLPRLLQRTQRSAVRTGQQPQTTQSNRSSTKPDPQVTSGRQTTAAPGAETEEQVIQRTIDGLDLPPELKQQLSERVQQLIAADKEVNIDEMVQEITDKSDAAQDAKETLQGTKQKLVGMQAKVLSGKLSPEEAKAELDKMLKELGPVAEQADHPKLKESMDALKGSMEKFKANLDEKGKVLTSLKEQFNILKNSGKDFKQMEAKLLANINESSDLNPEEKKIAENAIKSWKAIAKGDMPPLTSFAPGIAAALKLAFENSASILSNMLSSGLLKAENFKGGLDVDDVDELDAEPGEIDPKALTGGERFRVSVHYMATLSKILAFLSELKSEINAIDGDTVQGMAELDRAEIGEKLELAKYKIQKSLESTSQDDRAAAMKGGMKALNVIIAVFMVAVALCMCFSWFFGVGAALATIVLTMMALVISCFMLTIELISLAMEETTGQGLFETIAIAAGDPEAASTAKMVFGGLMAVGSIGCAVGAGAAIALKGAQLATKLGIEVVKGAGMTAAKEAVKVSVSQGIRAVVGGTIKNLIPTLMSLLLPAIMKGIEDNMEDDPAALAGVGIAVSILAMIAAVLGGRVAGGAISGGVSSATKGIGAAVGAAKGLGKMKAFFKSTIKAIGKIAKQGDDFGDAAVEGGRKMFNKTMTAAGLIGNMAAQGLALGSAALGIIAAEWSVKARESDLEAEIIQGLIDIIDALRKGRAPIKKGILDDMEHGVNELVKDQHKLNQQAFKAASEYTSALHMHS